MLDKIIEPFVGAGVDRAVEGVVARGADLAIHGAGATEPSLDRREVAELVRAAVGGAGPAELDELIRERGIARPLVPEWRHFILAQACRRVETPLFRAALALGVLFQLSVVALAVMRDAAAGLAVLAGLAFLLMRAGFKRWFEIHEALARHDMAQPERLVAAQLAFFLGPVAGHLWYQGHRNPARARPLLLIGAVLLAATGVPLVLSWLQARRYLRMSDAEYAGLH